MDITCSRCGRVSKERELLVKFGLAFCPACNRKTVYEAEPVFSCLSSNYSVSVDGEALVIKRSWRDPVSLIWTVFLLFLPVITFLFILYSNKSGDLELCKNIVCNTVSNFISNIVNGKDAASILIASLISILVLLLIGGILGNLLNTTEMRVDGRQIAFRTYPLFFLSSNTLVDCHFIEKIFCEKAEYLSRGGTHISFRLIAKLKDGKSVLLATFSEECHADAYKAFIEKRLGLYDGPADF